MSNTHKFWFVVWYLAIVFTGMVPLQHFINTISRCPSLGTQVAVSESRNHMSQTKVVHWFTDERGSGR
jgi:hypothetical protein